MIKKREILRIYKILENYKVILVIFLISLYNIKIRKGVKEEIIWQIFHKRRLCILQNWQCLI